MVVLGVLMYFFLPPKRNNYSLYLQLDCGNGEECKGIYIGSQDQSMEIEAGTEVFLSGHIGNATLRWQTVICAEGGLFKISIYNGTEKIYERGDEKEGKYTFPWQKGYRLAPETLNSFSYTFEEAGTYTVVAESDFKQLWKSYSYKTEALTVVVK